MTSSPSTAAPILDLAVRHANKVLAGFAILIGLLLLYMLSLGPALWLGQRDLISIEAFAVYTAPAELAFPEGSRDMPEIIKAVGRASQQSSRCDSTAELPIRLRLVWHWTI